MDVHLHVILVSSFGSQVGLVHDMIEKIEFQRWVTMDIHEIGVIGNLRMTTAWGVL